MWKFALASANWIGIFTSAFTIFIFTLIFCSYCLYTKRYSSAAIFLAMLIWTEVHWITPEPPPTKPTLLHGIVTQVLKQDEHHSRFFFKTSDGKYLLTWYRDPKPVRAGQRWEFIAALKSPHRLANPGSFDLEAYCFTQGVTALGSVSGSTAKLLEESWKFAPLAVWRDSIIHWMQTRVHTDPAWLLALIFGDKQTIDPRWQPVLRATGTNHLLAISGLHIGLMASLLYAVFRTLWSLWPRGAETIAAPQVGAIGGLIMGVLYAWLAGFALSTERALIMLSVILWGTLTRQASDLGSRLSFAFVLLLIMEPFSLLQAGFVLSFYAVFLLWYGSQERSRIWPQVVMTLGLIPVSVYYFQQISLVSFLANMVAIPWVELVVLPLLLVVAFLALIWPTGATWLLILANASLKGLFLGLEWLAAVIPAYWSASLTSGMALVSVTIAALLLVAPRGWPAKYLAILYSLPLFLHRDLQISVGEFWLTQLEVGQGNASLIRTAHHTLLFDAGPPGLPVIGPYLQSQLRSRLDRVIISHADMDHRGGLEALRAAVPIQEIWTSDARWAKRWKATQCRAGQHWTWDGVRFSILHPPADRDFGSTNEGSCVLQVRTADHQVLLTGDIQALGEAYLIHQGKRLRSTVLLAPHHGSKTSSSAALIAAVQPQWVIFSTGFQNRFHFPNSAVVARYQSSQVKVINTAECGAVTFKVGKTAIQPECYRDKLLRFYRGVS